MPRDDPGRPRLSDHHRQGRRDQQVRGDDDPQHQVSGEILSPGRSDLTSTSWSGDKVGVLLHHNWTTNLSSSYIEKMCLNVYGQLVSTDVLVLKI